MHTSVFSPSRILDRRTNLQRTSQLRNDVFDLLEAVSDEHAGTPGSPELVGHLQQVANDLGAAERMLLGEA